FLRNLDYQCYQIFGCDDGLFIPTEKLWLLQRGDSKWLGKTGSLESKNPRIAFVEYYLRKFSKNGDEIIDIGCGAAQYRHSTSAHYVGLDLNGDPYSENCPRDADIIGSGMQLPIIKEQFDLVFTFGALYQMTDPYKAIVEFYRILKPNGRVVLIEYNRRTEKRLQRLEM